MAVVEVEMVSGFIPNKGSLKKLKENAELGELRIRETVFYWLSCYAIISSYSNAEAGPCSVRPLHYPFK